MGGAVFTPEQRNWQFYDDATPDTSKTQLANENTKPNLENDTDIIRMRFCIAETGGKLGNNVIPSLQYDTDSGFPSPQSFGSSQHWDYADGADTEGNMVDTLLLSDTDTANEYLESASQKVTVPANAAGEEFDFAIVPTANVSGDTTYYFRILLDATAVPLGSGETYPQVFTAHDPTTYDEDATLSAAAAVTETPFNNASAAMTEAAVAAVSELSIHELGASAAFSSAAVVAEIGSADFQSQLSLPAQASVSQSRDVTYNNALVLASAAGVAQQFLHALFASISLQVEAADSQEFNADLFGAAFFEAYAEAMLWSETTLALHGISGGGSLVTKGLGQGTSRTKPTGKVKTLRLRDMDVVASFTPAAAKLYESVVTLASAASVSQERELTISKSITLLVEAGFFNASNHDMVAVLTMLAASGYIGSSTHIMEAVLSLIADSDFDATQGSGLLYEEIVSLVAPASISSDAIITYDEVVTLSAISNFAAAAKMDIQEAISLLASSGFFGSAGTIYANAVTFAASSGFATSPLLTVFGAVVLTAVAQQTEEAVAQFIRSASFDAAASQTLDSVADLNIELILSAAAGINVFYGGFFTELAQLDAQAAIALAVEKVVDETMEFLASAEESFQVQIDYETALLLSVETGMALEALQQMDAETALDVLASFQSGASIGVVVASKIFVALERARGHVAASRGRSFSAPTRPATSKAPARSVTFIAPQRTRTYQ
jgi:hypothetical protein